MPAQVAGGAGEIRGPQQDAQGIGIEPGGHPMRQGAVGLTIDFLKRALGFVWTGFVEYWGIPAERNEGVVNDLLLYFAGNAMVFHPFIRDLLMAGRRLNRLHLFGVVGLFVGVTLYLIKKAYEDARYDVEAERLMVLDRERIHHAGVMTHRGLPELVQGAEPALDDGVLEARQAPQPIDVEGVEQQGPDHPQGEAPNPVIVVRRRAVGVARAIKDMKMRFPYSRVGRAVQRGMDSNEVAAERTCIATELQQYFQQNNWRQEDRHKWGPKIVAALFKPDELELEATAIMTDSVSVMAREFNSQMLTGGDVRGGVRAIQTNWPHRFLRTFGYRY